MDEVADAKPVRRGRKRSDVHRVALLDAAEVLMRHHGYGAVTSRRVAREAGVGHQLVHYYFRNMDELYVAVFRRGASANIERLRSAMESQKPLRALWEFVRDPQGTAFTTEFTALASHSPAVREEIVRYAEEYRRIETEALSRHLEARGIRPRISPMIISVLLVGISSVLSREASLGFTMGHDEVEALMEEALKSFEHAQPTRP
jgi:AcrR family transcriptional regulator